MSDTTTAGEQEKVSMPSRRVEEEEAECGEQEVEQELRQEGECRRPWGRYLTVVLWYCGTLLLWS